VKTRKPTGLPAYPLILVEGQEKAGKSFTLAQLSASPLVDRTFLWDLNDGTLDEYAELGPYELVETNGTYSGLLESVKEATAVAPAEGKINVYGIDSGTDLWDLLKSWTDQRARRSKSGKAALAADPDAAIDPAMNLWNDAKDRWASVVNLLRRAPGVGVITAQGGEVAEVKNGSPTGRITWSVNAEKTITGAANAWVRLQRDPRKATLIGVRKLHADIPDGGLALPLEDTLHHLVFDILGGANGFGSLTVTAPTIGVTLTAARFQILERVQELHPGGVEADQREWVRRHTADCADEVSAAELADLLDTVPSGELVLS
jgi:hypothetical protein